jgi:hypothetical protein
MAKFGEGHVAAMGRLGLQELRNAANPSRESVSGTEMGLYGTATQLEVNQDRGNAGNAGTSMNDMRAEAQAKTQEQEKAQEQEKGQEQSRGMEM